MTLPLHELQEPGRDLQVTLKALQGQAGHSITTPKLSQHKTPWKLVPLPAPAAV